MGYMICDGVELFAEADFVSSRTETACYTGPTGFPTKDVSPVIGTGNIMGVSAFMRLRYVPASRLLWEPN